jgi:hypothetical protein
MESPLTLVLVLLTIFTAAVASLSVGSVSVRSLEPEETRRLTFRPAGGEPFAVLFEGGSEVREPFWTGAGESLRVGVEVGGYPPTDVEVHAWRRTRLLVPDDLLRPIVLLRPGRRFLLTVTGILREPDNRVELEVDLPAADGSTDTRRMPYDGHTVWIGCSAECDVPPRFVEQWEEQPASIAWRWLAPRKLDGPVPRLDAGETLEVRVTLNGEPLASRRFTVRGGSEVQMEELNVE